MEKLLSSGCLSFCHAAVLPVLKGSGHRFDYQTAAGNVLDVMIRLLVEVGCNLCKYQYSLILIFEQLASVGRESAVPSQSMYANDLFVMMLFIFLPRQSFVQGFVPEN